jgi:hypothetical protein
MSAYLTHGQRDRQKIKTGQTKIKTGTSNCGSSGKIII